MATNLQLQRQAVSYKAILDFTVQRLPQLPETVLRRFPELRSTSDELERLRINLQLQLREQFVAIREILDKVATVQTLDTAKVEIADEIKKVENKITNISNVVNVFSSVGKSTADTSGTVKTDKTIDDPVVYLKVTIDELLAALETGTNVSISEINNALNNIASQIFSLNITVEDLLANASQYVHTQLNPITPWVIVHGRTIRPGGLRIMTTPDYREIINVATDDSVSGQLTITFGYNVSGLAILAFS